MESEILQKRFSKGIRHFYLSSVLIITFGYLFEFFRIGQNMGFDRLILLLGVFLNIIILFLYIRKKTSVELSFGIVGYTVFFISIVTSLVSINSVESHIYMIRDNMFFTLIIVFSAFIVGRMHALILSFISVFYIIVYTFISKNQFLIDNMVLLLVIIIGLGLLLYFLKSVLDSALTESAKLNIQLTGRSQKIEEQNEILKEQSFELKTLNSNLYKKEEVLLEQKNELHIANDTKNKLFSILAHDLKDLVNTTLGLSNFLGDNSDASDQNKYSELIQNNLQRLSELLENLLEWSKAQSKKIRFNKEPVSLFETANVAIQPNLSRIKDKSIILNNSIPQNITVLGDRNLLEIIFRNLITNAVKFTRDNMQIEISAVDYPESVLVEIIDEGIGLDEDLYTQIFTLLPGESNRGTKGEKGTGLGLSICKEFVELHGGCIGVKPNKTQGSIFWFTLPK